MIKQLSFWMPSCVSPVRAGSESVGAYGMVHGWSSALHRRPLDLNICLKHHVSSTGGQQWWNCWPPVGGYRSFNRFLMAFRSGVITGNFRTFAGIMQILWSWWGHSGCSIHSQWYPNHVSRELAQDLTYVYIEKQPVLKWWSNYFFTHYGHLQQNCINN